MDDGFDALRETLRQRAAKDAERRVCLPERAHVPLASDEVLVCIGDDAEAAWSVAARLRAASFVLVTNSRQAQFEHRLFCGLFAITGNAEDFATRLLSRVAAPQQAPLMRDTAHHVTRALTADLGQRLTEAEKALIVERLWRAAHHGHEPRFLQDYDALEKLARAARAEVIWGDPCSFMTLSELQNLLRDRSSAVARLVLLEPHGAWRRLFDDAPWQRIPLTGDARAVLLSATHNEELDARALAQALAEHPEPQQEVAGGGGATGLGLSARDSNAHALLRFSMEALSVPYVPLLEPLLRTLDERRAELERVASDEDRAVLNVADHMLLHDDDPSWRAIIDGLLGADERAQPMHANVLAYRLGLFGDAMQPSQDDVRRE